MYDIVVIKTCIFTVKNFKDWMYDKFLIEHRRGLLSIFRFDKEMAYLKNHVFILHHMIILEYAICNFDYLSLSIVLIHWSQYQHSWSFCIRYESFNSENISLIVIHCIFQKNDIMQNNNIIFHEPIVQYIFFQKAPSPTISLP